MATFYRQYPRSLFHNVPPICPLSGLPIVDPLRDRDGTLYNRSAIVQHVDRYHVSPRSGLPLHRTDLSPDWELTRSLICQGRYRPSKEPLMDEPQDGFYLRIKLISHNDTMIIFWCYPFDLVSTLKDIVEHETGGNFRRQHQVLTINGDELRDSHTVEDYGLTGNSVVQCENVANGGLPSHSPASVPTSVFDMAIMAAAVVVIVGCIGIGVMCTKRSTSSTKFIQ